MSDKKAIEVIRRDRIVARGVPRRKAEKSERDREHLGMEQIGLIPTGKTDGRNRFRRDQGMYFYTAAFQRYVIDNSW